jgi:putative endonuclease
VGEQFAAAYLASRGYRVIAANQRTPYGELDLVCARGSLVVIVEVKARAGDRYGSGLEAIGTHKARRLRTAALWWLAESGRLPCPVRFDAVVVGLGADGRPCSLRHIPDVLAEGGA